MNSGICEAVRLRKLLEFDYRGTRRVVEPHAHGVSPDRLEVLVGFQRSGESSAGNPTGWKAFHAEDLCRLRILEESFEMRDGYRPGGRSDNLRDEVHCCL
jgi:hypothetical protein